MLFTRRVEKDLQNVVRMMYSQLNTNTKRGVMMRPNKVRINLVITQQNREALDNLADQTGLSISDIVRRLIDKATTNDLAVWESSKTEDNDE